VVHRWRFQSGGDEAREIAASCRRLIDSGLSPREILILLSNQRKLGPAIIKAMQEVDVECEHPREEGFIDSPCGRLVLAALRIVGDSEDYVSHRALLGLRNGVGDGTCNKICEKVIENSLNFRSLFYDPLPDGVFNALCSKAIQETRTTCTTIAGWKNEDTLELRCAEIGQMVGGNCGAGAVGEWDAFQRGLPRAMDLQELRDFLWADTDDQRLAVFEGVMGRLGKPIPEGEAIRSRVRIMTMHGAKGLSGTVVFIPGLEEQIIPGPWKAPYPGLVLESARLLYVSITRARAACILSYARKRVVHGQFISHTHSRFAEHVGGPFDSRAAGLSEDELKQILSFRNDL
jgi:DNA helicase-2/ATP-dependent DNA helicase PcrA